jgi:hypothetical protein
MNSESKYYLTILFLSILSICQAQNTIGDIEIYLFSEIFESNNSISEFIELNEENDTIRYWIFDKNGKLTKELDYRNNSWSSSVNGQITNESTTYETELVYNYNQDGELNSYIETKNIDGNIQRTIHEFKYLSSDTIIETFNIVDENFEMSFELRKITENSRLKNIVQVSKNHIGTSYVQTIQMTEFSYNPENSLTNQYHYFSVNSFSENEKPETMNETLGAITNYIYDDKGRLKHIHEEEYTEEGLPKLRKDVNIQYKGKSKRIKNIEVNYGESYKPNLVKYEIKYKRNGDIRKIKVNDNCFNYLTRR